MGLLALLAPRWLAHFKNHMPSSVLQHTRKSFLILPVCIREFFTSINYGHIFRIRL
jgi:hypothetical protein